MTKNSNATKQTFEHAGKVNGLRRCALNKCRQLTVSCRSTGKIKIKNE